MTLQKSHLLLALLLLQLMGVRSQGCVGNDLDPKPYAPLISAYTYAIVNDLRTQFGVHGCSNLLSVVNNLLTFNCSGAVNTTGLEGVISYELGTWGYTLTFTGWDTTTKPSTPTVTMQYTGEASGIPAKRLLLLSAQGKLVPSVNIGFDVQIQSYSNLNVWSNPTNPGARVSNLFLDFAPLDPSKLADIFVSFFCFKGQNVSISYSNLDALLNETVVANKPRVWIREIRPEQDECAMGNYVCSGTCVDGLNPPGGYTCRGLDGDLFQVDSEALLVFNAVNALLPLSPVPQAKATNIVTSRSEGTLVTGITRTYEIALSESLGAEGPTFVAGLLPFVKDFFKNITGLHPDRLNANYGGITVYVLVTFPAQVSVQFNATGSGLAGMRAPILNLSDLVTGSDNPIVEITSSDSAVITAFKEDAATINTLDYKIAACTLFKNLFAASKVQEIKLQTGRIPDPNTFNSTDSSCVPPSTPPANVNNNSSKADASTIAAIVVVVVLIIALIIGGYLYMRYKKKQKQKPVEEF